MPTLLLGGCGGRMGRAVMAVAPQKGFEILCGIDRESSGSEYPVFQAPDEWGGKADVILDFSSPALTQQLLTYACRTKTPLVIATTGHSAEQWQKIRTASESIPIFHAKNFSIGFHVLLRLATEAVKALPDCDMEILEKHHNKKSDAPSGSALDLLHTVQEAVDHPTAPVYDRHLLRRPKQPGEIGVHTMRVGNLPGEHEVWLAAGDEVLILRHTVFRESVFAEGALCAAAFLYRQRPGLFTMDALLDQQQKEK